MRAPHPLSSPWVAPADFDFAQDPRPAAAAVAPQRAATTTAAEKVEVEDGFEWLLERPIERVEPATAAQPADEIDANNTPTRPFPSLTLTDEVEIDWPQLSLPEFFFDAEAEMGLTANAAATPASSPVAGKRRRDVSDLDDGGYGVVDKKRTKWGEGGLMVGPLTPAESLR